MKIEVMKKPVRVSFALTIKGKPLIVVDSRLPKAKQLAAIAELKARLNPPQSH